jgi:hypothetical protein
MMSGRKTLLVFAGIIALIVVVGFVFGITASAIMILCFSAFFAAYLTQAYTTSFQIATFPKAISMVLGIVGIIMLFIATNWKLGLASIAGYWLLFTFSRLFWYRRFKSREELTKKMQKPSVDMQVKAAMAACIATEMRAGRTREEAIEICRARVGKKLDAGLRSR